LPLLERLLALDGYVTLEFHFFADFGGASKAPPHVAPLAERLQRPIYMVAPQT
jgi:hypothetical protein